MKFLRMHKFLDYFVSAERFNTPLGPLSRGEETAQLDCYRRVRDEIREFMVGIDEVFKDA